MDRRKFILTSSIMTGAGMVSGQLPLANNPSTQFHSELIKPKKLSKGDTIGLIAPGSAISRNSFEKSLYNIDCLGFKIKYSDNLRVRKGFLGGTDAQRIDDIHNMFNNREIDGIMCARGGYGCARLLQGLDYGMIKSNPKVLIGFSDITALLYAIHKQTGLVCFHGPVGTSTFTPFTESQFEKVLMKGKNKVEIERPNDWNELEDPIYKEVNVTSGTVKGTLVGGSLSLMVSLIGTPYDIDYTDKILFIEEVKEDAYRVDRMLTQLLLSGKLNKVKGIALGVFRGCDTQPDDEEYGLSTSLTEVITDRLGKLNIPVLYGLPIGHIYDNATVPFGIEAELDADRGRLTLLEPAVI
jgi:muramoyltetrapeptide carboxypeptidase